MSEIATQSGAFIEFATVAESVNAATSRSEKTLLLQAYFSQLWDDHLVHSIRYFTGHAFPLPDRLSAPIGEVTFISAFSVISGTEPSQLTARLTEAGNLASVAATILTRQTDPVLTLEDVAIAIEQLSKAKGRRRLNWVIRLLERATPLEATYLVRVLSGEALGEEEIVETAIAQLTEQPLQQVQWVHTLLGDLGKTAVLARHRQLDQARMQLFQPIKFMLASVQDPAQTLQSLQSGYAVEPKYDGIRAQAHIAPADRASDALHDTVFAGIRVALFSRTLQEITADFPDLLMPLAALTPRALVSGETAGLILDGEIVPYQNGQFLPFASLQPRLSPTDPESAAAAVPVLFVIYDLLYKDGVVLIDRPYVERRQMLETLIVETDRIQIATSQQFFDLNGLEQQYRQVRAQGQEGLMVKGLQSPYRPGRRSQDWLKVKHPIAILDVMVTAAEIDPAIHPTLFSCFAVAVRTSSSDPTLLNIGKVCLDPSAGSDLQTLSDWVSQHTIEEFANGQVRLVEPQLVLEIVFDTLQPSARHKGGYVLDGPKILRLRSDQSLQDVDTLATVCDLAELQAEDWWNSRIS